MNEMKKEEELLQNAQKNLKTETEEFAQVSTRLNDNLVRALRLMRQQLLVISAVVLVLVIAYFFVLGKTSSTKPGATSTAAVSSSSHPTQQLSTPTPLPARENLLAVLKQIREAQLRKDINLILQAYSPSFPDLGEKKERILKTWEKYDFLDLHFSLENIQQINAHTIIAKVFWTITVQDVRKKNKRTLLKIYNVHFSNSSGKWLIQELSQENKKWPQAL
jgi:hypothetical protein